MLKNVLPTLDAQDVGGGEMVPFELGEGDHGELRRGE